MFSFSFSALYVQYYGSTAEFIFYAVHADIDECASQPCLNGGTCTDLEDGYLCSCPLNIDGLQCQITGAVSLAIIICTTKC